MRGSSREMKGLLLNKVREQLNAMPGNQGGRDLQAQSGSSVKGWNKATLNPPTLAVFVIASRRKSVTVLTSQCIRCSGSHVLLMTPVPCTHLLI